MARVYADVEALAAWLGCYPPANAAVLLARASLVVDSALTGAVYDIDDDAMPTDSAVVEVMSDAVCAQVESWLPRDPKTGVRAPIGRLTVVEAPSARCLCSAAWQVLHLSGLLPARVQVAW